MWSRVRMPTPGGRSRRLASPIRAIFVYRPGAIGDTILTLPALAALRQRYPGCRITFAGNTAMLPLLPIEQALSADDRRLLPLFGEPPRPWPGADLHVVFARQPAGLPGIQRDPLAAVERGRHVADWLVEAIDEDWPEREPQLEVEAGEGAPLVIHPGAGSAAKRWPEARFNALVRQLALPLAVVRGPADPPFDIEGAYERWDNLPLPELARRLKGSGLFVGNDSGITHLAAAVGMPTLAIYVTTDPAIWGVRGAHTRRLQSDVGVAAAAAAAGELLQALG